MNYGRYQVVSEIGRGSMGVVYQAHDPQINRLVALKVLREDRVSSADYMRRFLQEATAVGRLSHRGIVTVYDIGQDHGTVYIAMELVEGVPLDELMKQRPLDFEEIISIGTAVAEALHYAHQKGIVHRDVKPANIICSANQEVKVTDFGIAHIEDPDGQQMTQAGEILGTPVYMSPEQVTGQPVDGRSDIYSLGVILYELATGQRPFKATNLGALFKAITSDQVSPPMALNPAIPDWLSAVIMKAIARDPANRPVSGEQLARELRNDARQQPDIRRSRPQRSRLALVLLFCLLLLTGGVGIYYYRDYPVGFLGNLQDSFPSRLLPKEQAEPAESPARAEVGTRETQEPQDSPVDEMRERLSAKPAEVEETKEPVFDPGVVERPVTGRPPAEPEAPTGSTEEQTAAQPGRESSGEQSPEHDLTIFSNTAFDAPPPSVPPTLEPPSKPDLSVEAGLTSPEKRGDGDGVRRQPPEQIGMNVASLPASSSAAPPPPEASTLLKLTSRPPGARIYIDGDYAGDTPSELTVSADKHEVALQLPGHGDWKAQLDLSKGGEMPLSIRLVPK